MFPNRRIFSMPLPKPSRKLPKFDKYDLYTRAVQSPENDVKFFSRTFQKLKGRKASTFLEDFCGTFRLSCEWVKLNKRHHSFGLDLDKEPIAYGMKNYLPKLSEDQRARVLISEANVLDDFPHGQVDIVAACNFSYFLFKTREQLRAYFQSACRRVKKDGVFIIDCFGGSACLAPNEEEVKHPGFSYFWDQEDFNPITNEAKFSIHFQRKTERKRKRVFTYDWRLWSIPELREVLAEAGFQKSTVFWEGTERGGTAGNGVFRPTEVGEACESFVAYIISERG